VILKLAPVALLSLALLVPLCTGTVWGNLLLLLIVCGIFFGTISLGQAASTKSRKPLGHTQS
jgi:hypothetical protein